MRMLLATLLLLTGCSRLPPLPEQAPTEQALPTSLTTRLDRLLEPAERAHRQQSGFRLVDDGYEAFALRLHSSQLAERSLDVQTYIWHADLTGGYLAHALLQAADRGVKVRLLVDDMDARQKHYSFAALAAHPNIAVRLFNPFASRSGLLGQMGEVGRRFGEINQRMHNKAWIADNRLAIAGGRNLGDEYFGASQHANFVDLDLAMAGPVVRDVSASFDRYWNAQVSYPIALLAPADVSDAALARLRQTLDRHVQAAPASRYASALDNDELVGQLHAGSWPLRWTGEYRFLSDDPLKVRGQAAPRRSPVFTAMLEASQRCAQNLWVISPYFVPGAGGMHSLRELRQRGCAIRVVTNSLAANDVVAVHSGYRQYREELLAAGVELWELKPLFKRQRASLFGSSGASLHSKALVIDGRTVFVGSYNLDPRSNRLNTEQGVLLTDAAIGTALQRLFERQANGERAWRVSLEEDGLHWRDERHDLRHDPDSGATRRLLSRLLGLLPIERQL